MHRRTLIRIIPVTVLLALVIVGGIALILTIRRPFPDTDGTAAVAGIGGAVEFHPRHWSRDEVDGAARDELVLVPEASPR
ncbi:MAG: hypothetical protein WD492_02710 [Alkalispirochaeta sp.]